MLKLLEFGGRGIAVEHRRVVEEEYVSRHMHENILVHFQGGDAMARKSPIEWTEMRESRNGCTLFFFFDDQSGGKHCLAETMDTAASALWVATLYAWV